MSAKPTAGTPAPEEVVQSVSSHDTSSHAALPAVPNSGTSAIGEGPPPDENEVEPERSSPPANDITPHTGNQPHGRESPRDFGILSWLIRQLFYAQNATDAFIDMTEVPNSRTTAINEYPPADENEVDPERRSSPPANDITAATPERPYTSTSGQPHDRGSPWDFGILSWLIQQLFYAQSAADAFIDTTENSWPPANLEEGRSDQREVRTTCTARTGRMIVVLLLTVTLIHGVIELYDKISSAW